MIHWLTGSTLMDFAVTSHDPAVLNRAYFDFWADHKLPVPWYQTDFYESSAGESAAGSPNTPGTLSCPLAAPASGAPPIRSSSPGKVSP